jgi:hypothetical protein
MLRTTQLSSFDDITGFPVASKFIACLTRATTRTSTASNTSGGVSLWNTMNLI